MTESYLLFFKPKLKEGSRVKYLSLLVSVNDYRNHLHLIINEFIQYLIAAQTKGYNNYIVIINI